jgi:hypothetical protein
VFLTVTQKLGGNRNFAVTPNIYRVVEKLKYINRRFYWYDVFWQKADGRWKKRSRYLRPASTYGVSRLGAGLFGFGLRYMFRGVPWHNFQEQMLIKERWEGKIRRERLAKEHAKPEYHERIERAFYLSTPSVAFIQYQASHATELRAEAKARGTAINYGALMASHSAREEKEEEKTGLGDALKAAEAMMPGSTEDDAPEATETAAPDVSAAEPSQPSEPEPDAAGETNA